VEKIYELKVQGLEARFFSTGHNDHDASKSVTSAAESHSSHTFMSPAPASDAVHSLDTHGSDDGAVPESDGSPSAYDSSGSSFALLDNKEVFLTSANLCRYRRHPTCVACCCTAHH
jgi:hypothetical protein